jgi:hypothetical protein
MTMREMKQFQAYTTLTRKGVAPHGCTCQICHKTAKEGQYVLMYSIPNVMHVVFHISCLSKVVDATPDDLDSSIQAEYDAIKTSYIEGLKND